MNPKISVIVPVYKTEKYVAECIDSILAQTYTNFRLILVDDGTPDRAGAICDEYAAKDERITVIHQENAGVTRARARGVKEAEDSVWVTFVDSDDKLHPNALYEFITHTSDDVDIVLNSTFDTEEKSGVSISTHYTIEKPFLEIEDYRKKMISLTGGMPWGRLIRKSIITELAFDIPRAVYYGEDAITNARIAFNTEKKVAIITTPLYFYRVCNNGVCKNFTFTHEYESLLNEYLQKSIPEEEIYNYGECLVWRRCWMWTTLFNQSVKRPNWSETPFHKGLIRDIKKYKYNIALFDWLLIKHCNPIIRFIIILTRKGCTMLQRFI